MLPSFVANTSTVHVNVCTRITVSYFSDNMIFTSLLIILFIQLFGILASF